MERHEHVQFSRLLTRTDVNVLVEEHVNNVHHQSFDL